jgi:hypothetical protein
MLVKLIDIRMFAYSIFLPFIFRRATARPQYRTKVTIFITLSSPFSSFGGTTVLWVYGCGHDMWMDGWLNQSKSTD